MCHLRNIAMLDYQESVTTRRTDAGQSNPYVPLSFAGNTIIMSCLEVVHVKFDFGVLAK